MNKDNWVELEVIEEFVYDGALLHKIAIGYYSYEKIPRLDIAMYHTSGNKYESYRPTIDICQHWFDRLNWHKENIAK